MTVANGRGRRWWWKLLLLLALVSAAALVARYLVDPVLHVPSVAPGPPGVTVIATARPALPGDFGAGAGSRAAIYLTDPAAPWLGLAFGLRTIGVPFIVTTDANEAVKHRLVLAYPTISGQRVPTEASMALRTFVDTGGTLLGFEILGAGLNDVFGIGQTTPGRGHRSFTWTAEMARASGFTEPQEQLVPLVGPGAEAGSPGYAFEPATGEVLARFEGGEPALLHHAQGRGHAYAMGLDIGAFMSSAQQGRRQGRGYVNAYEPGVDVLLRWLRLLYRNAEPMAVTLATVPEGRPLAVLLSHDVDTGDALRNSLAYASAEAAQHARATYFIQTKYVRDWNDKAFFDIDMLRSLQALGGEIASHSVAHSPMFASLPTGSGSEQYPGYVPFVKSYGETREASLLGELRVSRYLLQQALPASRIDAFRPGHLAYPFSLPETLQSTGYRYSSSLTSGTALSHLPYQLSAHGEGRAPVAVWEFPISLEDERVRPMDTVLLPKALELARQLGAYGGMCMVLIHPGVLADKLRFQQAFVSRMREAGAWIGSLGEFAHWWEARDGVQVDVEADGGPTRLVLHSPVAIKGLALQLPAGWRLAVGSPLVAAQGVHGQSIDLPAGKTILPLEAADRQ
jgi:hypothetical protein